MKSKKVELLAPAGSYDSLIGAINAGADAVYAGGDRFSARANADNFSTEALCGCIRYAHLFGRRVYLTLNTLIKEEEFGDIYAYVKPFYLAGLDGVIIQDLGVLSFLKEHFPGMELHVSTQMAVTGRQFVSLCKELGISRVVPARELSLKELRAVREAGIEVECFIHGAMCYCYSGMCLMSSILGGRSGNRGRCAQPCRLPYDVEINGKKTRDTYTLSLKDMCTIEHIPELIEAGMDSFKIEGRMKRPEYAAGVTALYRKYIDQYYADPGKKLVISEEDRYILEHLYMRSELHDGYLFKHNGSEMVTRKKPSYSGMEESLLKTISQAYLGYTQKKEISMYAYFSPGEVCTLTAVTEEGIAVTVNGPIAEKASKRKAEEADVIKQLGKLGNTHFVCKAFSVTIEGEVFLPNAVLNTLRRDAVKALEDAVIYSRFPELRSRFTEEELAERAKENKLKADGAFIVESTKAAAPFGDTQKNAKLTVLVKTPAQLQAVLDHGILEQVSCLYLEEEALEAYCAEKAECLAAQKKRPPFAYALPFVMRDRDISRVNRLIDLALDCGIHSFLIRNMEELALLQGRKQEREELTLISDASLYCWNRESYAFLRRYVNRITLPYELNTRELKPLRGTDTEQILYGFIPLMVTANCIYKTNADCQLKNKKDGCRAFLTDRYGKKFTVITNCKYCFNTLYNSVPLSLHKKVSPSFAGFFRLQFGPDKEREINKILDYYENWMKGIKTVFPAEEYTTAHENRQVE